MAHCRLNMIVAIVVVLFFVVELSSTEKVKTLLLSQAGLYGNPVQPGFAVNPRPSNKYSYCNGTAEPTTYANATTYVPTTDAIVELIVYVGSYAVQTCSGFQIDDRHIVTSTTGIYVPFYGLLATSVEVCYNISGILETVMVGASQISIFNDYACGYQVGAALAIIRLPVRRRLEKNSYIMPTIITQGQQLSDTPIEVLSGFGPGKGILISHGYVNETATINPCVYTGKSLVVNATLFSGVNGAPVIRAGSNIAIGVVGVICIEQCNNLAIPFSKEYPLSALVKALSM